MLSYPDEVSAGFAYNQFSAEIQDFLYSVLGLEGLYWAVADATSRP